MPALRGLAWGAAVILLLTRPFSVWFSIAFDWYISVAKQSSGETEGSGLKGHRDLKYNFSSIFQIDKTDPAMTCQSYVVKGQNDLLSEP